MILITSFLHRRELHDIIGRWLLDRPQPDDVRRLAEIINYNAVYVERVLRSFSDHLFSGLHPHARVAVRRVRTKGELKDLMVRNPPYTNERIQTLIRRYDEHPERYFLESPFAGYLYSAEQLDREYYVGSARMKRVRRIAEKGARRITDFLFEQVKMRADSLAEERARRLGVTKAQLVTSPDEMAREFERAERRIGADVQRGRLFPENVSFRIEDVAGLRVMAEGPTVTAVIDRLNSDPRTTIIEEEIHSGRYNATNLIVRHLPDREALLAQPLGEESQERLARRGLHGGDANRALRAFVEEAEPDLHLEIIVSSYQETLEAEIGRCMHEDRLVRQRLTQRYRSPLAKNVVWLMEYLFSVAIAPANPDLSELPIKLWIKYMPDYFDEVLKDLFVIPSYREVE